MAEEGDLIHPATAWRLPDLAEGALAGLEGLPGVMKGRKNNLLNMRSSFPLENLKQSNLPRA